MHEEDDLLQQLRERIAALEEREGEFRDEIRNLHVELRKLAPEPVVITRENITPAAGKKPAPQKKDWSFRTDLERFIGENLINKIGIAITVIGVGIGTKYAIEHQLISPVTRIALGYLVAACLLLLALKLRKGYENFSAVLLSGSMALMYFITYAAFSFYHLYPQLLAFIMMVLFTVASVVAALSYNRQIIAVGGMVGAFAVPFLLSEGSANVMVFFTYISIINTGVLVLAFKKYWKPLYFSAFGLTWLIFFTWYFRSYSHESHFAFALGFLSVFFTIFYLTFLAYKLIRKEKFVFFDIVLLLANSFIFFGLGYAVIYSQELLRDRLGLFCICNALIHAVVSFLIFRSRLSDRDLFFMVSGLGIVFLTIAIPVQLSGNWVTLLWICEAAVLFGTGRLRNSPVYEKISYVLLLAAIISLADDLSTCQRNAGMTNPLTDFTPFIHAGFLAALVFIASFSVIILIAFRYRDQSPFADQKEIQGLLDAGLSSLFILVVFFIFRTEIQASYNHFTAVNTIMAERDPSSAFGHEDLERFRLIWLGNYALGYLGICLLVLNFFPGLRFSGTIIYIFSVLTINMFLFRSLYQFSELRESYLASMPAGISGVINSSISIRYLSLLFAGFLLASMKTWKGNEKISSFIGIFNSLLIHLAVLWILCSELLNIMDLTGNVHSYRFGLSILAGAYAFFLIVAGISRKQAHLRIAAIVVLGATLAKLFFYDITRLDTILKTLLFLILGALLLVVSFLYNKYKEQIFGSDSRV